MTDFENSALTVFTGMIANLINELSIDFIVPISLVDENMTTCQHQDALTERQFWFRVDLFDQNQDSSYLTNML